MEKNFQITKGRLIAFCIMCIWPTFFIGFGTYQVLRANLYNSAGVYIYSFILPLLAMAFFALVLFSKMHAGGKTALCIFLCHLYFISSFFASILAHTIEFRCYENDDIGKKYDRVIESFEVMPTLNELEGYDNVKHYYYDDNLGFIASTTDTLSVYYSEEEYIKQKALLDTKYVFCTEDIIDDEYTVTPYAQIGDYYFRMLDFSNEAYGLYYHKSLICIATNDKDKSISYMAFYTPDYNHIESFDEFILDTCGWKYILDTGCTSK